jgi:hypothetical protein
MKILGPVVAVTLLIGLVMAGGCETSTTSGGTTSYSNSEYNFSFKIADRFEKAEGDTAAASRDAALNVAHFDPDGAKSGDSLRDGMLVSVYALGQEVTPADMPAFKQSLESTLSGLAKSDPSITMQPLADATVGGVQGYVADYTMTLDGMPVQARTYFVAKGQNEYQITIQSSQDNWPKNESDLQKAVDSFTLT